jgi:putative ABC transport system permease protein
MNSIFRLFRTKPLRSFITLIQIAAGSLAMTVALSALFSVRQNTLNLEQFDFIAGIPDGQEQSYFIFDAQNLSQLKSLSPDVASISIYSTDWGTTKVEYQTRLYEFTQNAYVDRNYFAASPIQLMKGSLFTSQDENQDAAVVLISDPAADVIFGDTNPIGQTLRVFADENTLEGQGGIPEPYTVVGTFVETKEASQIYIYLPYWRLDPNQETDTLAVLAKPGKGSEAKEQLTNAAKQIYGETINEIALEYGIDPNKFFYARVKNEELASTLSVVAIIFGFFGAMACIVGAIGIASVTVVNALERKRDIGVKRALGATRNSIIMEMIIEAVLLSALGVFIGVILAILVIPIFSQLVSDSLFAGIQLNWQPLAGLIVFVVMVALGMFVAIFPAFHSSRLNVVEALRHG